MPIEILPENYPDWIQFDSTDNIGFLSEDPFWRTKAGNDNPDQAILFRGGDGFLDRSIDGGKTWFSILNSLPVFLPWFDYSYPPLPNLDLGPTFVPPTRSSLTYHSYAGNPANINEHAILASYVVADKIATDWDLAVMWIAYTFDDWAHVYWQQLINTSEPVLTFGATQNFDDDCTWSFSGSPDFSAPRSTAVMSETKIVVLREHIDACDAIPRRNEVCVFDINGTAISQGTWVEAQSWQDGLWDYTTCYKIEEIGAESILMISAGRHVDPFYQCVIEAATVSGGTVTFGVPVVLEFGAPNWFSDVAIATLPNSKAVVGTCNYGLMDFYVVKVVGATIASATGSQPFTDSTGSDLQLCSLSASKVIAMYNDGSQDSLGKVRVGTLAGTLLTWGDPYEFQSGIESDAIIKGLECRALSDTDFVLAWRESEIGGTNRRWKHSRVGSIGTPSGSTVTFGDVKEIAVTDTDPMDQLSIDVIDSGRYIIYYYVDSGVGSQEKFKIGTVSGLGIDYSEEFHTGRAEDLYAGFRLLTGDTGILVGSPDLGSSWSTSRAYVVEGITNKIHERYYAGAMSFTTNGEHLWIPGMSREGAGVTFQLIADWLQRDTSALWDVVSYANWDEAGKFPRYYEWELYDSGLTRVQALSGDFFVHLSPWPYNATGLIAHGNMRLHATLRLVATHYDMVMNDWDQRASDASVTDYIWEKVATSEEVRATQYFNSRIYAMLNTSTGAELWESSLPPYSGGSNFTHKSDAIIDAAGDNAMSYDLRDGTIVVANDAADLLMVAATPLPYTVWYNLTLSHRNDRGVTGLIVL